MPFAPVLRAGAVWAALFGPMAPATAQTSCTEDAMIVFDGSGSMAEIGFNLIGTPRISEAREAMRQVMPEISNLRRLGLIIYGPGGDKTCENIDLRFGPKAGAGPQILRDVESLQPAGGTPLTLSVQIAAEALQYRSQPGTIVLVTDGDETCGGAPCELAAQFAANSAGLVVHVIGYKVRGDHFSWGGSDDTDYSDSTSVARCLAEQTGGLYVGAETIEDLIGALRVTLGCTVLGSLDIR
ncbi:vWA domain-containing protein [Thalassococcus lentus]|uniref:VWA domain-containing protein n=1 Tax=Thalassococcus lentus TaxID=1210524 RepID=A0ABT4XQ68_9RHOB|nr:vWA domain-containing protein [Thalassococcus lentus]MDA7424101.1 VWA domain-containing protein [Thalassococcus lentus]